MTRINYIVHSTTVDNEQGTVSGHYDCNLSPIGETQAKQLSSYLSKTHLEFGVIYSSTLVRAVQTGKILFPNKEILYDKRLTEIDYGNFTHRSKAEIDLIRLNHIYQKFENGESYQCVEKHIHSFLEGHKRKEVITIISHQAPQLALEVICNHKTWKDAFAEDWRLIKNGWQPFWHYTYMPNKKKEST